MGSNPILTSDQKPSRWSLSKASPPRFDLLLGGGLIVWTWLLMVLGALTRAARAGVACPDWPLCHGRFIPPLDAAFYPPDPSYALFRVYFEFAHRVMAGLLAVGTVAVVALFWRRAMRRMGIALAAILSAQIVMGAVTVMLRNAPFTVVIHLVLALSFLAVLVVGMRALGLRLVAEGPPRGLGWIYRTLAGVILLQLVLGGIVSSRAIGLACADFPLCNGLPIPAHWTEAIAWQIAHRIVGYMIVLGIGILAAASGIQKAPRRERAVAVALSAGIALQVLLGAMNVWFQIPPAVSAAHLGCAVLLFGVVVERGSWRLMPGAMSAS